MSHVLKFETVINNVSITYITAKLEQFQKFVFVDQICHSTLIYHTIYCYSTILIKSNLICIKPHWKHNHSDVNDAVHVRIVQFYFDHNFQLSIQYHKRKVIAYVNWFQNHNY